MDVLQRSLGLIMKALVGHQKKFKENGEEVDINKFLTKKLPGRWSGM